MSKEINTLELSQNAIQNEINNIQYVVNHKPTWVKLQQQIDDITTYEHQLNKQQIITQTKLLDDLHKR